MKSAIVEHSSTWLESTKLTHSHVKNLDIVIGLTYGTDRTTNNKENQILVKLMEHGFQEDLKIGDGVLVSSTRPEIRVYRRVGKDFWSLLGDPVQPKRAEHVYLEVMLGLLTALRSPGSGSIEQLVNTKIQELSKAIAKLAFPRTRFPTGLELRLMKTNCYGL
jgi:hypothetical protein